MIALLRLIWWLFWWIVRTIVWMVIMALMPFIAIFLILVLIDDDQRVLGWMWRFWIWTRELRRKAKEQAPVDSDDGLDTSLL